MVTGIILLLLPSLPPSLPPVVDAVLHSTLLAKAAANGGELGTVSGCAGGCELVHRQAVLPLHFDFFFHPPFQCSTEKVPLSVLGCSLIASFIHTVTKEELRCVCQIKDEQRVTSIHA